jgi:hypothetical protein
MPPRDSKKNFVWGPRAGVIENICWYTRCANTKPQTCSVGGGGEGREVAGRGCKVDLSIHGLWIYCPESTSTQHAS